MVAPLTYSVPLWNVTPKEISGDPGMRTAFPLVRTYTPPPLGAPVLDGSVPSLTNTCPSPKANAVGVVTPVAASWSFAPLAAFGSGVVAADAPSAKAPAPNAPHTTVAASNGLVSHRFMNLFLSAPTRASPGPPHAVVNKLI